MFNLKHAEELSEHDVKLSIDFWKSIEDESLQETFYDLPFLSDSRFSKLPIRDQKFILGYTLKENKGFAYADLFRFASGQWDTCYPTAQARSLQLRNTPAIRYYIEQIESERVRRMGYTVNRIRQEETILAYSDITDFLDDTGLLCKNPKELPPEARRAIKSIEVVVSPEGETKYKVKLWDKGQALARMERMKGLNKDQLETNNTNKTMTTLITSDMDPKDASRAYSEMLKGNV